MSNGSLVKALEDYFLQSEQLETRLWLSVNEQTCAALMLQRMPGERLVEDDFVRSIHLAATITKEELHNTQPEKLLHLLFNEDTLRLFDAQEVQFSCKCSEQRVVGVLQSLGKIEMESLLQEKGRVEVNCEYCGKDYLFDPVDIASLFSDPAVTLKGSAELH